MTMRAATIVTRPGQAGEDHFAGGPGPDRPGLCKRPSPFFKKSALRTAFTLIELLVVIAIISLLVSILLPSLTKAKDLAKNVICKTNLKSLGMTHTLYAQDYDNIWCPMVEMIPGVGWKTWVVFLRDYVEGNNGVYQCPFDPGPEDLPAGYFPRTYGQNIYIQNYFATPGHSNFSLRPQHEWAGPENLEMFTAACTYDFVYATPTIDKTLLLSEMTTGTAYDTGGTGVFSHHYAFGTTHSDGGLNVLFTDMHVEGRTSEQLLPVGANKAIEDAYVWLFP